MAVIRNIANHHTGGLKNDKYASTGHLSWEQVNEVHRVRPDWVGYRAHKSTLGYYGGYNFFIQGDGFIKQFRAIGEETLAQTGYNFDTVSICLAGNFIKKNGVPVNIPNIAQIDSYKRLVNKLLDKDFTDIKVIPNIVVDITIDRIHPHSWYQQTECNGLPESWGRDILTEAVTPQINNDELLLCRDTVVRQQSLIAKLLSLLAKLLKT